MAYAHSFENQSRVSQGLYNIVCRIIGPESLVKLRRQRWNILELLDTSSSSRLMPSGSAAEGFMFESSDTDFMFILKNFVVLKSNLCRILDTTQYACVLIMETDIVSPGFTLLRCFKDDLSHTACVYFGYNFYINSKLIREGFFPGSMSSLHGPCRNSAFYRREYDMAPTLQCPIWPEQAMSFIHRSLRYGWPSYDILKDICKDGCLLVPINSKQQACRDVVDLELRISFSLAEKKLIHSMNHCQFLCYGLMKLFLNEVLKNTSEVGDLLCSYFMKTAVFWEILECKYNWSKYGFLEKFMDVFRRVLKWVSAGYCPNFFIPEHNMFYGKIHGRKQKILMLRLQELHNEGILCLHRCPSLQEDLSFVINNPYIFSLYNVDVYVPQHKIEEEKLRLIMVNQASYSTDDNIPALMKELYTIASRIPTSKEMAASIKLKVNFILHLIAIVLHSFVSKSDQSRTSNKLKYCFVKTSQSILRQTKTFHCYNSFIRSICLYRNASYCKTIHIVNHIKHKLSRQPYMYSWKLDGEFIMGCRQQGISYDVIVKSFIVSNYIFELEFSLEELHLEMHVMIESTGMFHFLISPLVLLNFIHILCYTKLHKIEERNEVLCDIQVLVANDDGYHIISECVAMSWQILGICQQICGDNIRAYQSYIKALNHKYNYFKKATIVRICCLIYSIFMKKA